MYIPSPAGGLDGLTVNVNITHLGNNFIVDVEIAGTTHREIVRIMNG